MRKIIIVLLFTVNSVFAQTSIPSSGAVSMSQIATVMKNLGEITSGELATSYSLSFLNGKSHLVDKTAPFKISDWYGYAASGGVDSIYANTAGGFISESQRSYVCAGLSEYNLWYYFEGSLQVGTLLYSDSSLTTPLPLGPSDMAGMYKGVRVWFSTRYSSPGLPTNYVIATANCT